jgi:hypothetical protein
VAVAFKLIAPAIEKKRQVELTKHHRELRVAAAAFQKQMRSTSGLSTNLADLYADLSSADSLRPLEELQTNYVFLIADAREAASRGERKIPIALSGKWLFNKFGKGYVAFVEPPVIELWSSYELMLFENQRKERGSQSAKRVVVVDPTTAKEAP